MTLHPTRTSPTDARRWTMPLTSGDAVTWTVSAVSGPVPPELAGPLGEPVPATVPGEVHTDLLAAGLIPDPFDGVNEAALSWIGRTGWVYRTRFDRRPDGHERQDLVVEGLDTVATVRLNGVELGRTANQHRGYRFDVGAALVAGANELEVEFAAPVVEAERRAAELGARPHVNRHPYNAIRKMAASFGWDWGPDVAGAGIWKPLRIESWSGARIAAVRPLADAAGVLAAHVDLEWTAEAGAATVTVEVGGVSCTVPVAAGQGTTVVDVVVPQPRRWWPRGHGDQSLYDVEVRLEADGEAIDGWSGRVGFRTVTVDTAPDDAGSPFTISVNGEPVYVRGANWIPDHAFLTRLDTDSYRRGVADAVDAGMNLLRVWGGGIYESADFYRACDEAGVLVWQDFAFTCAAYAEEEPLRGEVLAEAREAVTRLSQHASLAVWNGGNEHIWGYVEWRWRSALGSRSWGEGYYLDLLPGIVAELDPGTPYSPASPFSFGRYLHPNDERHATMHIWDVWNELDYTEYRSKTPRFVSEFGFQGPAAWSTLTAVVHDDPLDPAGPQMLAHQKADDGNGKLARGLGRHLPPPRDTDDWHWSTQLNQARAVGFGIEHFRSLYPYNTGSVMWQLNDNWPVISWSAVDAHGIRKPLWFTLRRVYADRLLTVQPRDGRPALVVHNDSAQPWSGQLSAVRYSTAGTELAAATLPIEVGARDAVTVALPAAVAIAEDPAAEFVRVSGPDVEPAHWYFVEDPELALSPVALSVEVVPRNGGVDLHVTASALVKDIVLMPDRLDPAARVDSGMITLVAGERHTFAVTGNFPDPAALTARPVLRCANDLVAR